MDRRTFNKLAGVGLVQSLARHTPLDAQQPGSTIANRSIPTPDLNEFAQIPPRSVEWPARTYRRLLVDTHVPDWDESLLASFNSADYVSTIAAAGFQSLMQYANSHVGLCLWRTNIGQMHRNMKGRDYFGEVMEECRRHGLHRVAYYSLIFDDWAFRTRPDWRILSEDGSDTQLKSRTGTVCINSPYREHALTCLKELVGQYDFEAIFLDMTFWPTICYCPHCTARYWAEQSTELPRIVDWDDPEWRTFQRSRERWMREFVLVVTETIKKTRPIQVCHQSSSVFSPWTSGVSLEQLEAADFCSGDFYGGMAQFSLACKAFLSASQTQPFEFCTSRTLNLRDFETTKPFGQFVLESMIPMIHSSACLTIDAIKPDGTLNHQLYKHLSQINALHDPYEPFLGGQMLADVAIYYDKNSNYDPASNGSTPAKAHTPGMNLPHLDAVIGAARILREAHVPFGVITNASLDQLSRYRALILPSVLEMSQEQAKTFRDFTKAGGILYASGLSSMSLGGDGDKKFLLSDVLGVKYLTQIGSSTTYLSPMDTMITQLIRPQENLSFLGPMVKVEAAATAQVLATITLPFVDPHVGNAINTRFAQIWSDPPALRPGKDPGIVIHEFGKGRAIWAAGPLESRDDSASTSVFVMLLKRALQPPYQFEADTERVVEVTLFHQKDRKRLLVSMLNLQAQVPPIPVDATLRIQVPEGRKPNRVSLLPEQNEVSFSQVGSYIQFRVPSFTFVSMATVDYE